MLLFGGREAPARRLADTALRLCDELLLVRLSAQDCLAQIALFLDRLDACAAAIEACATIIAQHRVPGRSWYDFAHQITRCAYLERVEDWQLIVQIADECGPELARRQYRALRTTLLCARARALAHLGNHAAAGTALTAAVRTCPRGAVDPLVVLEASRAVCAALGGRATNAATHFDRALTACRAIGHRYHETWIERQRDRLAGSRRATIAVSRNSLDVTDTALLLTDVAAILGAGHSIDLLAQRTLAILQSTSLGQRVEVESRSGCEYDAQPSATCEIAQDGTFSIALRGSDRHILIRVRGAHGIDDISLLKSMVDVVQTAMSRTMDADGDDDDQNLWPRSLVQNGEDTVFRSPRMVELLRIAVRLAATDLPVLITGETGTGKEVLARLVHDHSRVRRGPFVAFNCSAVPRELVESQLFGHRRGAFTGATEAFGGIVRAAEGGTLFLDELGDLEAAVQPKLLRFLETGEITPVGGARATRVPVRLVAATNADVDGMLAAGRFRADLFYRIGGARLHLPPLRERKDEIPALASLFVTRFARECGRTGIRLGDDFIAALLLYNWPGNIRELANEVRRVVALADDGETLSSLHLAPAIVRQWTARPMAPAPPTAPSVTIRLDQTLAQAVGDLERRFIDHALAAAGGRVADAAQLLGLSRKGLFLKRRRRGLAARGASRAS